MDTEKENPYAAPAPEWLEEQAAKSGKPALLFSRRIGTAISYLHDEQLEKAKEKWRTALGSVQMLLVDDFNLPLPRNRRGYVWRLESPLQRSIIANQLIGLGPLFENAGDLAEAEEVYAVSYRLAMASDRIGPRTRANVEFLAQKFRDEGDTVAGARLLTRFLRLAREYREANSGEVLLWKLKLINYYARCRENHSTKRWCADFLTSLRGSGMAITNPLPDYMVESIDVLRVNGYKIEADRVARMCAKIRKLQAATSNVHIKRVKT
ncbi:MAG: hypothetical protein JST89_25360 [Cyanobacteria bacterium SZAS-4]|nr:hypothetical protein [Cyanobacteria bacterium SZAS-4]